MPFGPAGERQDRIAVQEGAQRGIGGDEPAYPGRGTRAEPAGQRNPVDAAYGRAMESATGGLVDHARAPGHDIVGAGIETLRPLAFDRDGDAIGFLVEDLVVETKGQTQHVEAGAQVGGRRRHAHFDRHDHRIPAGR